MNDLHAYCLEIATRAKKASAELAVVTGAQKQAWLRASSKRLVECTPALIEANQHDLDAAPGFGLTDAAVDRLRLTPPRIQAMATALEEIAMLPEPVGEIISSSIRPNGLEVQKVRVPLGVVFFIYESRPNVTSDAAAICVKSGNAVILRGGKEAAHSNRAIVDLLSAAAAEAGLPADAVQLVATTDRAAVGELLRMPELIDVAIPRGGESLIRRVSEEARMPVIKHFAGNCHVYIDRTADADMAERLTVNSKCQRLGVCNAAESLLVHADAAAALLPRIGKALIEQRHRDPRRRPHDRASARGQAGHGAGLLHRVSRPGDLREGGGVAGRGDPPHQSLQLAAHRDDRHPRSGSGPAVRRPRRQLGRDDQRQHAVQRRRRIRPGGGNRHQHRQIPRPRPLRTERIDQLQVCCLRQRPDTRRRP